MNDASLRKKFQYRLFASVDVAGSTAFKQRDPRNWVKVFEQFFSDFPDVLKSKFESISSDARGKPMQPMRVWKYAGDEILFVIEVSRYEECMYHCYALVEAVSEYQGQFDKHKPLGLKCSIWGAGFPVRNAVTKLTQGDGSEVIDYLGPDIDLGFRLGPNADTRRIPVNMDLAYFLVKSSAVIEAKHNKYAPVLLYEQSVQMKGILGGVPYPLVWIDRMRGVETFEDKLLGRKREANNGHLLAFVENFLDAHTPQLRRPFIATDHDDTIKTIPKDMITELQRQLEDNPDYLYEQSTSPEAMQEGKRAVEKNDIPALPAVSAKLKGAKRVNKRTRRRD